MTPEGIVAGFADATGRQLPLVCTLNGAPVLAAVTTMLGVDFDEMDRLALSAPAGAQGLTLVPYLEGERSPNLPGPRARLHGVTTRNLLPANVARAAVEGLLASMAYCVDKIAAQGVEVRTHHPDRRGSALGSGPAHRTRRTRRTRARADARRVRRAWGGQAGGMDAVTTGFAAVVVVRE